MFKGGQEQFFFLQTLLFTAFFVTVLKFLTYGLVSPWSSVSSGWEHVKRKMHPCLEIYCVRPSANWVIHQNCVTMQGLISQKWLLKMKWNMKIENWKSILGCNDIFWTTISQVQRQYFRAAEKSPDGKAEVIICEVNFLSTSWLLSWAVKVVVLVNTA